MYIKTRIWNPKNGIDEPIFREGMETDVENGLVDIMWEERVGRMEKVALTYIQNLEKWY